MKRAMTPDHEAWHRFVADLRRAVPTEERCGGTFSNAKSLLQPFPEIDWSHTFLFFVYHGAACDHEILANIEQVVAAGWRRDTA